MTTRSYGILASVIGSVLGAWWYSRRRVANRGNGEQGTVIFDNTPSATPMSEGTA